MNINLKDSDCEIDIIKLQKMAFIYNTLEKGWNVSKKNDLYIFKKNHEGKKEVFSDNYLKHFISENVSLDDFLNKK